MRRYFFCLVKDIFSISKNEPTLITDFTRFPYMKDYVENFLEFDNFFSTINSSWALFKYKKCPSGFPEDLIQRVRIDFSSMLAVNNYKYTTLFNTMGLDYNPIENYRMVETETINREDNFTTDRTEDLSKIVNMGEIHGSSNNTIGAQEDTTTNSVAPMNTGFTNRDKQVSNMGSRTDNNTYTQGSVRNMEDNTNNIVDKNTGTQDTNRNLTRSGNIGVTTSQQMLQSEREVALFSFYSIIWKDFLDNFAFLDGEEDCSETLWKEWL